MSKQLSPIAMGIRGLPKLQLAALAGPIMIVFVLAMMVLPLPAALLDIFFTFNIALSLMVLLIAVQTQKPLEFAVFPTVLLVTTLFRLSLNVASTRIVLMEGHTGPDAAGKVIEAFGHFLVGGNFAVGVIVFAILVVINFVVITKGAGRIAEVSARFALDAMPGKQMAIDADLNAGLIKEEEAKTRRREVAEESEFYGSMDGASKFVRGDAIAGIVILALNLLGGLIIGVAYHDLDFSTAARNYTLLTIGDGLVAQIPALIISIAAGVIVSRVGSGKTISEQFTEQLLLKPEPLFVTAGIVGLLGIIPGMPHIAFLAFAAAIVAAAVYLQRHLNQKETVQTPVVVEPVSAEPIEASWDDVIPVDAIALEVGYRLVPLVDPSQNGELIRRIKGLRKKFAQEVGFLPPLVHVRDNLDLAPNGYRILIKGVEVARAESQPSQLLAINPGGASGSLPGTETLDPAFGLPAVWIEAGVRDMAQSLGFTVVDPATVIATHLNHNMRTQAADLLSRAEVQQLVDHLSKEAPKVVEEVVPKLVTITTLHRVLANLLAEGFHIRDRRTIIETLAELATANVDPERLTAHVRVALGPAITQELFPGTGELSMIALDPEFERLLAHAVTTVAPDGQGMEPGLANRLLNDAQIATQRQQAIGYSPVMLAPPLLRPFLGRFFRRVNPHLRVLSHAEVPETRHVRIMQVVGAQI
jgi:flagellar biosynthesis protein FlhA